MCSYFALALLAGEPLTEPEQRALREQIGRDLESSQYRDGAGSAPARPAAVGSGANTAATGQEQWVKNMLTPSAETRL